MHLQNYLHFSILAIVISMYEYFQNKNRSSNRFCVYIERIILPPAHHTVINMFCAKSIRMILRKNWAWPVSKLASQNLVAGQLPGSLLAKREHHFGHYSVLSTNHIIVRYVVWYSIY